jgi:hypothetical protein
MSQPVFSSLITSATLAVVSIVSLLLTQDAAADLVHPALACALWSLP